MLSKYDKETELEAKIVQKIAQSSIKDSIKIFIPNISESERKIYSRFFKISKDCKSANFVYDKNGLTESSCKGLNKLFFTNNYKRLLSNKKYYGAFFWNKSRPNIVFVKQRLDEKSINLPKEYEGYIEEFYE